MFNCNKKALNLLSTEYQQWQYLLYLISFSGNSLWCWGKLPYLIVSETVIQFTGTVNCCVKNVGESIQLLALYFDNLH